MGEAKVITLHPEHSGSGDRSGSGGGLVSDLIQRIEAVGPNLIVVKTKPGGAGIVADAVDRADLEGLVGTVAGDDTLFLATRGKRKQARIITAVMQLP